MRSNSWARIAAGAVAGLLLHFVAGRFSSDALAQGSSNTTATTSTSSGTSFESPPACSPVGSSRVVQTVTIENTTGPATIVIGDRDRGGTAFEVLAGTNNINLNTHTQTFQCVAAGELSSTVTAVSYTHLRAHETDS